jgi:hypothetical protein
MRMRSEAVWYINLNLNEFNATCALFLAHSACVILTLHRLHSVAEAVLYIQEQTTR